MKTNLEWLAEIPNSVKAKWMFLINKRKEQEETKQEEKQEHKYLTEAHRQNSESAMKYLEEQSKKPLVLEEVLANQRKREQQEHKYLNEVHKEKSEKAQQAIKDSKKILIDWNKEAERQGHNSQDHTDWFDKQAEIMRRNSK